MRLRDHFWSPPVLRACNKTQTSTRVGGVAGYFVGAGRFSVSNESSHRSNKAPLEPSQRFDWMETRKTAVDCRGRCRETNPPPPFRAAWRVVPFAR